MQQRAAAVEREAAGLRAQVLELAARVGPAEEERDAWQARALEAERQLQASWELLGTRRVRAGRALGRCLDRVRRRP
jgi:hypothetical protein